MTQAHLMATKPRPSLLATSQGHPVEANIRAAAIGGGMMRAVRVGGWGCSAHRWGQARESSKPKYAVTSSQPLGVLQPEDGATVRAPPPGVMARIAMWMRSFLSGSSGVRHVRGEGTSIRPLQWRPGQSTAFVGHLLYTRHGDRHSVPGPPYQTP